MKIETQFTPQSALEASIKGGNFEGVIAALRAMPFAERKAQAAALKRLESRLQTGHWERNGKVAAWWGSTPTREQMGAAGSALFFCGGSKERAEHWQYDDIQYPHLDLLEPAALRSLATELVGARPVYFAVVQRLVREGLSDRPDTDAYTIGLMALPQFKKGAQSIFEAIADDPALLDGPLLRIFDVEGTSDLNMAGVEKYTFGDSWTFALLQLAKDGKLDRAQLLERCISTLERDWPQFRAGWFSRFHDQLAPTLDDMAPLSARYLGLCHSRIPPTVALALSAVARLFKAGRIACAALFGALVPVMSSAIKGQVDAALRLLDQMVKMDPTLALQASALAARALAHESPELHKKVVARLATWGFGDTTRGELETALPYVSPLHRDALAALLGVAPVLATKAEPALVATGVLSPLEPSRKLAPLNDIDELVQTIAFVFENEHEIDEFERALDAVVRLGPRLQKETERFSPVIKRVKKMRSGGHEIGCALVDALNAAFNGAVLTADLGTNTSDADLARRLADLTQFMAQQSGLPALSSPTHKRGFIDPLVLAERIAAHAKAGVVSTIAEQVRAVLRLVPGAAPDALRALAALLQTPLVQACRHALGDDVEMGEESALFLAAARVRHPGGDDARALLAYGDTGPDGALAARYAWSSRKWHDKFDSHLIEMSLPKTADVPDVRFIAIRRHTGSRAWGKRYFSRGEGNLLYAAAILPGSLETFLAYGAYEIGSNIDWSEANWHHKAYLALLIDPTVSIAPPALKLMALALAGKEPGQSALAVDAFAMSVQEGRTDVLALAAEIRWILLSKIGIASRYAKSLASAARAHPALPAAVVAVLCDVVDIGQAAPPKDTGALLELLLELLVGNALPLPAGARQNIALLKLTGKGKAAQKELLARFV